MNKSILKELKAMAATLPKQYEPWEGSMIASGSALIAAGSNEQRHNADKFYKHDPGKRIVNHFKRMKRAYLTGGARAVELYIDKVRANDQGKG